MNPRRSGDTRVSRAVFVVADPSDANNWKLVLGRLADRQSEHQIVTGHTDDADAVSAALLAGAGGWLFTAPDPPDEPLPPAPGRPSRPRWFRATAADGKPIRLSAREVNVLQGVADGHSLPRVARDLGLSTLTVRNHITRASHRFGARSRGHMVLLALRSGVIG